MYTIKIIYYEPLAESNEYSEPLWETLLYESRGMVHFHKRRVHWGELADAVKQERSLFQCGAVGISVDSVAKIAATSGPTREGEDLIDFATIQFKNNEGDEEAIVVVGAQVYIMNESGKTVDKINCLSL